MRKSARREFARGGRSLVMRPFPLPKEVVLTVRPRFSVAFFVLTAAALVGLQGQGPAQKLDRVAIDPQALGSFLAEQVASRELVGLSLAVMQNGKIVYAGGAGRASIEGDVRVTPQTRFAIGSITKQFTSAAALLLVEDGKLSVTDKVGKWFPHLTAAADITVLDLMNHVSGYPDYYPLDFVDRPMQQPIATAALIDKWGGGKLDFPPGARYSYSNTGFVILGEIVSKVSGEPFAAFLERRILQPQGLTHTVFEPRDPQPPEFARGYVTFALGPPEVPKPEGPGWVGAAGALYSTPSDLAKWDLALIEGRVLKPDTYKLMTSARKLVDGAMSNYGCGLGIGKRGDQPTLGHNGAVAGFYAQNTMFPRTKSAVILLSNFDAYDAVNRVYATLISSLVPLDETPKPPVDKAADKKPPVAGNVPDIAGPPADEAARQLFLALQAGRVDRALLGEEYSAFLADTRIAGASVRLKPYGTPTKVDMTSRNERGGMEVARTRLTFADGRTLAGLMYRTPDGKVQQFFVSRD
jgi:CubicO group peptidase (beta-lactamase class C family)